MKTLFLILTLTLTFSLSVSLSYPLSEFTVITSDSSLLDTPQPTFSSDARTDPAEQRAVNAVMRATGNSWSATIPDICLGRWHGIECIPDSNNILHVVSLSFGSLSLDTAFPLCDQNSSFLSPSLSKLPHLRSLFLYRCSSLNPTVIPSFLSLLAPSLRSLVLRENGHVGPIPEGISRLKNLRVLDLQGNALNSFVPGSLAGIMGLRFLDLSKNKLSGEIPSFGSKELRVLDLNGNLFNGQIPPSLGFCKGLLKLDLSKNRLHGAIPSSFMGLQSLILLDLSENRISGPLPQSLRHLTSLKTLILSENDMAGEALRGGVFDGLTSLTSLVLSNMGFKGFIPEDVGRLQGLRVLHLDGNGFKGSIPESFRELSNLRELRINDNRLSGPLPIAKTVLWRMGRKMRAENNEGLCYDFQGGVTAVPPYLAKLPLCGRGGDAAIAAAVPDRAPFGDHP